MQPFEKKIPRYSILFILLPLKPIHYLLSWEQRAAAGHCLSSDLTVFMPDWPSSHKYMSVILIFYCYSFYFFLLAIAKATG